MGGDPDKPTVPAEPTYVLADRDHSDIVHLENPNVIEHILSKTRAEATAYVGKLLQSGVPRYVAGGPRVAYTAMVIEGLTDLGREISAWIKVGRFPDDFSGRPAGYQTWVDLLREIDSNPVDGERLKAMKAMFFSANEVTASDAQSVVAYQLFQIAKILISGELLLLKAVYDAYRNGVFSGTTGNVTLEGWAQTIAGRLGHGLFPLVIRDSIALEQHGLINARVAIGSAPHQPTQNFVSPVNARITNLGIRFCENIQSYNVSVKTD
jgi:hypothetical protein